LVRSAAQKVSVADSGQDLSVSVKASQAKASNHSKTESD